MTPEPAEHLTESELAPVRAAFERWSRIVRLRSEQGVQDETEFIQQELDDLWDGFANGWAAQAPTVGAPPDEQVVWFHGTSNENAEVIRKEGFRVGTYFAHHMEDAVKFGGPHVFFVKVHFNVEAERWQVTCSNPIPASAIQDEQIVLSGAEAPREHLPEQLDEIALDLIQNDAFSRRGIELDSKSYRVLMEALQAAAKLGMPREQAPRWIPVEEKLPKEGVLVLAWFHEEYRPAYWRSRLAEIRNGHWRPEGGDGDFDDHITHWQPLPDPPGASQAANGGQDG